jgi:hypothetical protein
MLDNVIRMQNVKLVLKIKFSIQEMVILYFMVF